MKFLQISDTHLGYNQYGLKERGEDFFDVFKEAIDIAIDEKVDFILHSGDFFHTSRPSNEVLLNAIDQLKRLKEANIPIFAISGNHDRGNQVRDISPLKILENFGLNLVENGSLYYEGIVISGLKYLSKVAIRDYKGIRLFLEKILEKSPDKNALHLLMLHAEFEPFFPNSLNLNKEVPEGFDYIGIGHYHIPQKPFLMGNTTVLYAGSTEFTAYNEKEENYPKGIHLINYQDKEFDYKFLELKRKRPFIRINVEDNLEKLEKDLKEKLEESYEISDKKPVVILKGNVKNISYKDIYTLIEAKNFNEKVLHFNISLTNIFETESLVESLSDNKEEPIEYKLKEFLDDENLYNHVIDVIATLKTFDTTDEVKKYLKENPNLLDI